MILVIWKYLYCKNAMREYAVIVEAALPIKIDMEAFLKEI